MPATSGITVSAANAESCPAVRCAVAAISEAIGQLPVHVYQRGQDGTKERAPDHPVYELLHDAANDHTPATTFREAITRDALLNDQGGFAFIGRADDGRPVELFRLDPASVSVETDAYGAPVYKQNGRVFDRAEILHLRAPNGSPVRQCRDAIGLALTVVSLGVV